MERLLFGDNQFFGVNHMSEEKARAQMMRFQDLEAIINVLDNAYDTGVTSFMCTTHDRIAMVCDHMRSNPQRYKDFRIFASLGGTAPDANTDIAMARNFFSPNARS